ncbi:uncharacterized protein LOC144065032 [Stigmatopora argus]
MDGRGDRRNSPPEVTTTHPADNSDDVTLFSISRDRPIQPSDAENDVPVTTRCPANDSNDDTLVSISHLTQRATSGKFRTAPRCKISELRCRSPRPSTRCHPTLTATPTAMPTAMTWIVLFRRVVPLPHPAASPFDTCAYTEEKIRQSAVAKRRSPTISRREFEQRFKW